MSNNLYKRIYTTVKQEDKRLIDTNELVARRIEELMTQMEKAAKAGFISGLNAPEVAASGTSDEDVDAETLQNNIIKAGEEAASIKEDARTEAESILEEARAQAELLKAGAMEEAQQQAEQALAQARQQGYDEGKSKAEKEAEESRRQLREKERQLEKEYQKHIEELEPQFIETLTGIYEHIFHVDLQSYRETLVYLISSTMRKAEGNHSFVVHVSKEDYPYVSMEKKQIMSSTTTPNSVVEIIEDATLGKNECLIETDNGIFDCGLGTQLSELGQKLKLLSYEKEKR